jgi:PRC-barrel domain
MGYATEGFMRRFSSSLLLLIVGAATMLVSLGFLGGPRAQGAGDTVPSPQARTSPGPSVAIPEGLAQPSVTILGSRQAQSVLGKEVRSSADENMGRIVDVIVDHDGRVRAAVIDFGGFLGVGSRKIAVDWNALSFPPPASERDVVTLELTRDQVKAAPEYKDKRTVVVLGAAGALQPLPNE